MHINISDLFRGYLTLGSKLKKFLLGAQTFSFWKYITGQLLFHTLKLDFQGASSEIFNVECNNLAKPMVRQKFLEYTQKNSPLEKIYGTYIKAYMHPKLICRLIPFPNRVLDLGTGLGGYAICLERDGCEVHGVDIDADIIKIAQTRADKMCANPNFIIANIEKLPYKDESFDFCFANSLLEHVKNYQLLIDEVARVLKVNGLFALCTTNRLRPFQREVKLTSRFYFPFYGLLPQFIKKKFIHYCLTRRPDLINYTDYPAINWFTYVQLKTLLHQRNFEVFGMLEVYKPSDLTGVRKRIFSFISKSKSLKTLVYIFFLGGVLYALKE